MQMFCQAVGLNHRVYSERKAASAVGKQGSHVDLLSAWSFTCSINAYSGLEVLNPVNKPIAPHCKVLWGPVPV